MPKLYDRQNPKKGGSMFNPNNTKQAQLISEYDQVDYDQIYVNLTLVNNSYNHVPAVINELRSQNIIDNPEDYHMAVLRATINSVNTPAFEFLDNTYYMTLGYQGQFFTQTVTFYLPVSTSFDNNSRLIYSIRLFLTQWNMAFKAAFNALKTAFPSAPVTNAPFFIYDSPSTLISLVADTSYDIIANPNTVGIFIDNISYSFLSSLNPVAFRGFNTPNHADVQLEMYNFGNNLQTVTSGGPIWLINQQEFSTVGEFSNIVTVFLVSNNLPVVSEYLPNGIFAVPPSQSFVPNTTGFGSSGNNSSRIITDFYVDKTSNSQQQQSYTYIPAGEYRRLSLMGNTPIKDINLSFFYTTDLGQTIQMQLYPGTFLNVKLLFEKRRKLESPIP